jgi:hypothetical protein
MVYWDRAKLSRIWQQRQLPAPARRLGVTLEDFLRRRIYPKQKSLAQIARAWQELLPTELLEHTCLDEFRQGVLRIMVDSAEHLYELKLLIQEGLLDQLREKCPGQPLSQIRLVRGQWYRMTEDGNKISSYTWGKKNAKKDF